MRRIITITCTLMLCLATHAQRITASFQGTPLPDVLERLNILQHEYDICAINNELEEFIITADVKDATLHEALAQIVAYYPIRISTKGRTVYVEALSKQLVQYRGVVVGRDSVPLSYATVTLYNPIDTTLLRQAACSNAGVFVVPCPEDSVLARFTHVAHDTLWIKSLQSNLGVVEMHERDKNLNTMKVDGERHMDRPGVHEAQFPGGNKALEKFFRENVFYPRNLKNRKEFTVVAYAVVKEDGKVMLSKIARPRDVENSVLAEVRRIMKTMPAWEPATATDAEGKYVATRSVVELKIPFTRHYILSDNKVIVRVKKAGTLGQLLTQEQKDTITCLELYGKLNSTDILTLRQMAGGDGGRGKLEKLDLSQVEFVTDNNVPYLELDASGHFLKAISTTDIIEDDPALSRTVAGTTASKLEPSFTIDHSPGWSHGSREVGFIEKGHSTAVTWELNDDIIDYPKTGNWYHQNILNCAGLKEKNIRKFKGHKLSRENDSYVYKAFTRKGNYCKDMFYHCPTLRYVITPYKGKENNDIIIHGQKHTFLD